LLLSSNAFVPTHIQSPIKTRTQSKISTRVGRSRIEQRLFLTPDALSLDVTTLPTHLFTLSTLPTHLSASLPTPVLSAFAAYFHYLGLFLVVASLITERLLIKPDMNESDFDTAANADILYGISGTVVLVSGYFRATEFGKGWEFYAHEPIFWVKMLLFSVMGAASFFPTTKIIQRAITKKNAQDAGEELPNPWSPALIKRLTSIINAELLAVSSIPLAATLMSRGVGYAENFPWYAGAAPSFLVVGGLGYKYIKEALDWKEPNQ
ncbi:hypothetical protein TL16_g03282, partial [Triparma laevis f. inornata]